MKRKVLEQAGIEFVPVQAGLRVVKTDWQLGHFVTRVSMERFLVTRVCTVFSCATNFLNGRKWVFFGSFKTVQTTRGLPGSFLRHHFVALFRQEEADMVKLFTLLVVLLLSGCSLNNSFIHCRSDWKTTTCH
ncbi:MAG: hypothetical protein ACLQHK_08360 [Gallionellaceae bacterium]